MSDVGRLARRGAAGAAVALLASSCGLPGSGSARTVPDDRVPYHLLDGAPPSLDIPRGGQVRASVPVVFWVGDGDHLVPEAIGQTCAGAPEDLARGLLLDLVAGPAEGARALGRATAIPPQTGLSLVGIRRGTAEVEVETEPVISADRLPLAVGQVVLSLTSAPGVRAVALVRAGELIQVPLPGGALSPGPVGAADYAPLVSDRYRAHGSKPARLLAGVGCPDR
jgi:hypothetical protein